MGGLDAAVDDRFREMGIGRGSDAEIGFEMDGERGAGEETRGGEVSCIVDVFGVEPGVPV